MVACSVVLRLFYYFSFARSLRSPLAPSDVTSCAGGHPVESAAGLLAQRDNEKSTLLTVSLALSSMMESTRKEKEKKRRKKNTNEPIPSELEGANGFWMRTPF